MKYSITIMRLVKCKQHIPYLARLRHEQLAKLWMPQATLEQAHEKLRTHATSEGLPVTFVALYHHEPVGMISLRHNDGIQPERMPWLGGLVVDPNYRQQKIGEQLIDFVKQEARVLGHQTLYLLAFDPTIPDWYATLGWTTIGHDQLLDHPVTVMEIAL